ncbi:hypothetical protein PR048_010562 [Dryococelus australis]|uniref:Fatty acid synthase n=1 Tax=Dryococelus australis TaxID=614101 RepID=A0ABQ9I528_9NEOP|nr:hypothetical protein PR048_010562 [Dryococelus australis]
MIKLAADDVARETFAQVWGAVIRPLDSRVRLPVQATPELKMGDMVDVGLARNVFATLEEVIEEKETKKFQRQAHIRKEKKRESALEIRWAAPEGDTAELITPLQSTLGRLHSMFVRVRSQTKEERLPDSDNMPAQFPEVTSPALSPQPQASANARWNSSEEVVISGFSGRFPESSNVEEFRDQLLAGVDLITEDDRRWPVGQHGLPSRSGKLKDISRFDASFFGVHPKQAEMMDPQIRMMLELTYEAIVDAGVNPQKLRGSRTGVFVGMSGSESYNYWCSEPDKVDGYGLPGCSGAMFSNRISYSFDFKGLRRDDACCPGPSFSVDTACSSSMMALHQAVVAMRTGQCDTAVVGGVNLALSSNCALQFQRLNLLCPEGKCRSFDASGKGYVRSEAAVILLLQKKSTAKRVYATVVNTKINVDGFKEQGITFPSGPMQKALIQETFEEVGLDPAQVAYVEAHGTGTKVSL